MLSSQQYLFKAETLEDPKNPQPYPTPTSIPTPTPTPTFTVPPTWIDPNHHLITPTVIHFLIKGWVTFLHLMEFSISLLVQYTPAWDSSHRISDGQVCEADTRTTWTICGWAARIPRPSRVFQGCTALSPPLRAPLPSPLTRSHSKCQRKGRKTLQLFLRPFAWFLHFSTCSLTNQVLALLEIFNYWLFWHY